MNRNDRIDAIAEKMVINKYDREKEKKRYKSLIKSYLLNEKKQYNKNKLLNVIENVGYYKREIVQAYIVKKIHNIIDDSDVDVYVIAKERIDSSSHNMISGLTTNGVLCIQNVIECYDSEDGIKLKDKDITDNSIILIIDDYVGTGNSFIKIIKAIEKSYIGHQVMLLAYIWQKSAKNNIHRFLENNGLKNKYEIIQDDCIIEEDYRNKYKSNLAIKKYIEGVCSKCKSKNSKFGYKNTGAMLTINNMSPNNNISMLWRDDIKYNNWVPIFNRDLDVINLKTEIRKKLKSSYNYLFEEYRRFKYNKELSFEEYRMLILVFNSYCINIIEIQRLIGVDTEEETINVLNKFISLKIIIYKENNILEFIDYNVINQFKGIINRLSRDFLDSIKKK